MKLSVWSQTDIGLKRSINQDAILVNNKLSLFIVADGMGGHKGGEVASAIAIQVAEAVIQEEITKSGPAPLREVLAHAFLRASQEIFHKGNVEQPELMGMGTTMVLALNYRGTLYVGNVGDSRAYLFNDNTLWCMTEDHSLVNEQLRSGLITEAEMDNVTGKNIITRSVGFERDVVPDTVERILVPGEMVLMCSDGLCGLISDDEICQILKVYDPSLVPSKCIEAAKKAGGDDNISVIVISVD